MSSSSDSLRLTKTVTESKSLAGLREVYEPDIHVVTHCRAWAYPIARSGGLAEHAFLELTVREMGSGRCSTVRLDWYEEGLVGLLYSSSDAMRSDTELWHLASRIWNGVDQKLNDCKRRSVFVGTVLDACEMRMKLPYSLVSNNCQHFTSFLLRAIRVYADYRQSSSIFAFVQGEDRYLMEQLVGHELRTKLKLCREAGRGCGVLQICNCTVLDCPTEYMPRRMEKLLLWCTENGRRCLVVCSCNRHASLCGVRRRIAENTHIIDARTHKTPEVFHVETQWEELSKSVVSCLSKTFVVNSYHSTPRPFDLPEMLSEILLSRADNVKCLISHFYSDKDVGKCADLVVVQYERRLTDRTRAFVRECLDERKQIVFLNIVDDRRSLTTQFRSIVCDEMVAGGFGGIPHFFGVSLRYKNFIFDEIEQVEALHYYDVDGIVDHIAGISSGQATLHDILLSTWICKFFD